MVAKTDNKSGLLLEKRETVLLDRKEVYERSFCDSHSMVFVSWGELDLLF